MRAEIVDGTIEPVGLNDHPLVRCLIVSRTPIHTSSGQLHGHGPIETGADRYARFFERGESILARAAIRLGVPILGLELACKRRTGLIPCRYVRAQVRLNHKAERRLVGSRG